MSGILLLLKHLFPQFIPHNDALKLVPKVHSQGGAEPGFIPSCFSLLQEVKATCLLTIHVATTTSLLLGHARSLFLDSLTLALPLQASTHKEASRILKKKKRLIMPFPWLNSSEALQDRVQSLPYDP